jgi:poly-gamma-glutamate capsule biosynthesis protein CapA/YwtB (metallophosphatase superfamily)
LTSFSKKICIPVLLAIITLLELPTANTATTAEKTLSYPSVQRVELTSAPVQPQPTNIDSQLSAKPLEAVRDPLTRITTLTITAAGDCTLGTDEHFGYEGTFPAAYDEAGDASVFLQGVKDVFQNDDLTIVNMEGPLTNRTTRAEKTFAFKGSPDYVSVLKEGSVEAASLANNHSFDYGNDAFWDTFLTLGNAGIMPFGYEESPVMTVKDIPVGLVGINVLEGGAESVLLPQLKKVKEQGAQLIIVYFHWGSELDTYPDEDQRYLAHTAIDNGAHLVLGSHPHVIQGTETYNGRTICYSLGNFCFGGNSNPSDKDTMIFRQTFTFKNGRLDSIGTGETIPARISSTPWYNDYRPVILTGDEAARVKAKIKERSI